MIRSGEARISSLLRLLESTKGIIGRMLQAPPRYVISSPVTFLNNRFPSQIPDTQHHFIIRERLSIFVVQSCYFVEVCNSKIMGICIFHLQTRLNEYWSILYEPRLALPSFRVQKIRLGPRVSFGLEKYLKQAGTDINGESTAATSALDSPIYKEVWVQNLRVVSFTSVLWPCSLFKR